MKKSGVVLLVDTLTIFSLTLCMLRTRKRPEIFFAHPGLIRIDGIAYTLPQLTLFLEDQQKYFYETLAPEQLKAVDQYALYYFLEYCKDLLENKPSYVQEFGKEKTEQALNTLSAYYQNDLPETGDNTPIFLTLTALSVLGLVALAVTVGRKKKERL